MINLFISESYGIFSDPQSTRIRISCIIRASALSGKFPMPLQAPFDRQLCCATSEDPGYDYFARLAGAQNSSRIGNGYFPDSALVVISAPPSNRTLHFKHSITVNYLQKTTEQHLPWLMRSLHEDVVRILKKGKK